MLDLYPYEKKGKSNVVIRTVVILVQLLWVAGI
jgi:hypothetical protein